MNVKYECQNCFKDFELKYDFMAPFCSERCEVVFLDHAPVELVAQAYEEFKFFIDDTFVEDESLKSKSVEKEIVIPSKIVEIMDADANDINTICCETCYEPIDYGINDKRVQYFCSSSCVDGFLDINKDKKIKTSQYIN